MLPLVCPLCRIALPPVDDVCPRDGHPGREVSWLPVPQPLTSRFHVVEPFAHGHSGSLYIADEPETGRRGLLKVLAPVGTHAVAERQRLRRELVKQATLTRTHLLVPLSSGESEGSTWIFREWLDGVSLEVRLSREGALQQTEALAIAAQIATALDELHRGGLLHRDVKPGHIFLQPTPQGIPRALLLDAGVARVAAEHPSGPIYGTAGYIAPEPLTGKLVSFRSDLYSLGCVLYRMLTGRPAFAGETDELTLAAQRDGALPPTPADLPNGIGALLQSILAKDPQQRPFSAQKLRRTLDPFLPDGALMEKQPTTTFETVPTPSQSVAPQPSGTLKPPAHPSARLSMPAPPDGALRPRHSSAPPPAPPSAHRPREENTQQIDIAQLEEMAKPKRAASLPPPTPRAKSSMPPPVPGSASKASVPPPMPATPPQDKTQPIRLDQILAVANAQRSANAPPKLAEPSAPAKLEEPRAAHLDVPPSEEHDLLDALTHEDDDEVAVAPDAAAKPIEEDATGVFQPRHVAGAPRRPQPEPTAPAPALFAARDEPFSAVPSTTFPGLGQPREALFQPVAPAAPATKPASVAAQPTRPASSMPPPHPGMAPASARPAQPPVADAPATKPSAPPAFAPSAASASLAATMPGAPAFRAIAEPAQPAAVAPAPAEPSTAESFAKATLMGIGGDPLDPPALGIDGSQELPTMELRTGERDNPTHRVPLITPSFESGSLDDAFGPAGAAGSIPSGTLHGGHGQPSDSRRMLMYASAAVVGLAVLAVGASALRSKPEPVVQQTQQTVDSPPPLPASAAAAAAVAPAQAQRPVVESLKPSTTSLAPATAPVVEPKLAAEVPADNEPAGAPKVEQVEPAPSVAAAAPSQPALAPAEPSKRELRHLKREAEAAAAKASSSSHREHRSAKGAGSEKSTDKASLFAAARDEARTAYAAKRYKEAAAAYERASRYDPKHAGTFAGLGAARLQQGDNKAAIQAYQRAVTLSPDTSGFHAALGRAYLANGDKSKAAASYKRALALDPNNEAAKVAMKSLKG